MAAEGTSTAFIVSAVFFLLTFGSCFVVPSIGQETGYYSANGEYDILMPMMLGAFIFLPLGCLFLLGGLVASLFPSKDETPEEDNEQNDKLGNAILLGTICGATIIIFIVRTWR